MLPKKAPISCTYGLPGERSRRARCLERRAAAERLYTGIETANGFLVGLGEPPAGSTVTATTAPFGTERASGT